MTESPFTLVAQDRAALLGELAIEAGEIRTRRIFKGTGFTLMRLSLDAGAVLREHTAQVPILVEVLSGHATMALDGAAVDMPEGAIIHIDALIPHSVEAITPTQLLLTQMARPVR